MGHLCPSLRSRLAILVYQGSDPTPPYQALVIGQSVLLFFGFAPWGQSTLFGPRPGPASEGPSPLTTLILQNSPPAWPIPREEVRRSGKARDLACGGRVAGVSSSRPRRSQLAPRRPGLPAGRRSWYCWSGYAPPETFTPPARLQRAWACPRVDVLVLPPLPLPHG